jgi:hypothetical protein
MYLNQEAFLRLLGLTALDSSIRAGFRSRQAITSALSI